MCVIEIAESQKMLLQYLTNMPRFDSLKIRKGLDEYA